MWTIIKIDKKKIDFLKNDFRKILGKDIEIYSPTFLVEKYEISSFKWSISYI